MMDLTRLKTLAGLGQHTNEASTVNGRDTSNDNNWKQTSMSPSEAEAKGYEVRVKKGALRNGDDMVEVRAKVTEGRMKDELWDQAEMMDLEDFVANAGNMGMEPEEAAEFWKTANGMDESEVNEAPGDYPNVVSTKPGDGDYEKGYMYWDTETGELYKTHPGYEVKGSYDDFVAGRGEVKSGGDFAHMSDEELQDAINDAMEQGDQGAAEEYYAELEKRGMHEAILSPDEFMKGRGEKRDVPSNMEIYSDYKEMEATGDADPYQYVLDKYPFLTPEKLDMILGDLDESEINEYNDEDDTECNFCGSALHNGECPQCDTDEEDIAAAIADFVYDHKKHFDAYPMDVEIGDRVYDYDEYWKLLDKYEMTTQESTEVMEAPTMDTTQLVNLMRNSGLSEEAITQKLEEWANTPEGVGEVEPTSHGDAYDFAQSVNLSLKKYLDAQDMKVQVSESYTGAALMEAYKAYKGEVTEAEEVDEADVKEGNAFAKALSDAKAAGKKKFTVDGKEYTVEAAKPDFADIDDDGDKEESMKKAAKDKEEKEDVKESDDAADIARLRRLSGL